MFWRDDGWFWFLWVFVIKMVSLQPFSNTWLENLLNKKVSCWACLLFRLSLNLKFEDGSFPGIRRLATKISSVVGRLWPQPVGGSTLPSFGRFRSAFHYSTEKSLGDLYYSNDLGQLLLFYRVYLALLYSTEKSLGELSNSSSLAQTIGRFNAVFLGDLGQLSTILQKKV